MNIIIICCLVLWNAVERLTRGIYTHDLRIHIYHSISKGHRLYEIGCELSQVSVWFVCSCICWVHVYRGCTHSYVCLSVEAKCYMHFLNCFPSYFLRQDLALNLELVHLLRITEEWAPGPLVSSSSLLPDAEVIQACATRSIFLCGLSGIEFGFPCLSF